VAGAGAAGAVVTRRPRRSRSLTPAKAILVGFVVAIGVGTALLSLPLAHAPGASVDWLAALFTATSAVCVTGLVVLETGADWSPFGQVVILLLIKTGGIGILSLGALVALATGRRMGFSERLRLQAQTSALTVGGIVRFVKRLLLFTTGAEAIGALLLWPRLARDDGLWPGGYSALFHAVSAFNNAGFSLYGDSLERYVGDAYVSLVMAALFMLGGIGLVIVVDLALRLGMGNAARHRLTLHTRLALGTTVLLTLAAWAAVGAFEWTNPGTLGALEARQRPLAAFFQAVTPRTAGFHTLEPADYRTPTTFFTMLLMFVGGNPGSTAGGVKTTTLAVLLLAALAAARGRAEVTALGRSIETPTVTKAAVLSTLGVLLVGAAATLLTLVHPELPPLALLFETVSAFGTVGLSMGVTEALHAPARATLVVVMLLGRVGLLTVALALVESGPAARLRYPGEDVVVG
jgi:trk system potassium uptake protein